MAILLRKDSRICVQGLTGRVASAHTRRMVAYGARVVAGVSPYRAGSAQDGLPVFATVREAVAETGAEVSLVFTPPDQTRDALIEAADAGVSLVVCVTEGTPVQDMLLAAARLEEQECRLIGPCSPGIIVPGLTKAGFLPEVACMPGPVGIMSRSGTLSYEAALQMTQRGIGQSTWLGVGGEQIKGMTFRDLLPLWEADPETRAIALLGEIGGRDEEDAADWYREHGTKPLIALIAGRSAPAGVAMGHAAAMISEGRGGYAAKVAALEAAGAQVARTLTEMAELMAKALDRIS